MGSGAYLAYYENKKTPPNSNTMPKLFWVGMAMLWCQPQLLHC